MGAAKAHGAQAFLGKDILRDKRSPSLLSSENDREYKNVYTMHGSDDVHKVRLKASSQQDYWKNHRVPAGDHGTLPPTVVGKALRKMKFSANLSFLFQEHKDLKDRCV